MIEAMVQAGSLETTYRRMGSGRHLLLLVTVARASLDGLVAVLAERFTVLVPELPACVHGPASAPEAADQWLRGFLDGLGLDRPLVIADPDLRELVLRFTRTDADRLGRLALLHADDVVSPEALLRLLGGE